jgi:hypothetical protein
MDEAEYWKRLEFRVCRELEGMRDNQLRFLWCDGFNPEEYLTDDGSPRITGRAWICNGPRQDEWGFTLTLPRRVASRDVIDWQTLMPADNVTKWLTVDQKSERIQIDLATATPHAA